MENTETYNGWTNYATWRVNLEIFDGLYSDMEDEKFTPEGCKDYAEDIIGESGESLTLDYAMAFLGDVNWYEIAEALNEK